MATRTRQGNAAPKRQTEPAAVLVGKGPRPKRLQQVKRGLEECSQGSRPPSAPPGGQPFGDAARLPVRHFYEEQAGHRSGGQLEHHESAFVGRQPLVGAEGSGPESLKAALAHSPVQLLADCNQVPDQRVHQQPFCQGSGDPDGDIGRRYLPTHAMGPRSVQACSDRPGSPDCSGHPPDPRSAAEDHHPSQRDWPLPPTEEAYRGNGVRCDPLDSRDPEPNAGSPSRLHADWEVGSQRVYSPGSLNPETFQAGTISAGYRGGQDDPGTLRPAKLKIQQLQLSNPHQRSYAHATLLSLLWTASCIQDGLPIASPGLRKFLQWLSTQSKPQPLWQTLAWQALTKTWSHPLRHHDPAAFLHYLQPLIFTAGAGEWQARSLSDASPVQSLCQVSASGHAWPISLPAVLSPANPCSLQSLMLQWHGQAQVHGLSKLSPVLALRIHRFDDRGNKLQFSLLDSWSIDIPCS